MAMGEFSRIHKKIQLETVIYTPTLADFSGHWNAESPMLAVFLVHPELLLSSLQTGKQQFQPKINKVN
jgi:hypothetical protein